MKGLNGTSELKIIHLTHVRKVAYVKPSTLKAARVEASGLEGMEHEHLYSDHG